MQRLALIINFHVAAILNFRAFFERGGGRFGIGERHIFRGTKRERDRRGREFQAADEDVVVKRITRGFERIVPATTPRDMPVLPVVGRMRD